MRKMRAPIEVFSLSFLDIISCAFGAVVMLILLAKNGDDGEFNDVSQIASMITAVTKAQSSVSNLQGALSNKQEQLKQAQASSSSNADKAEALVAEIARAKNNVQQLTDQASGLKEVEVEQQRAAINAGKSTSRADEVGGIPVDSDYVIFIVDTSGSMKNMWGKVMTTLDEVLNNHPQVVGFQILSDNGEVLNGSSLGKWRQDTRSQRRIALTSMQRWRGSSNSSPVEGIEKALQVYGKTNSLALYVFGDDYSGGSYDLTLARINKLNTTSTGKKISRIHGIAFKRNGVQWGGEVLKFSTLMREVSKQNDGTFLAL